MKSLFALLLIVFYVTIFPFASKSQAFEGIVKDSQGNAIPYASLCWSNYSKGICCDSLGNYKLLNSELKTNADTIVVSSIGYASLKLPYKNFIRMQSIVLPQTEYQLSEVVIRTKQKNEERFGYASLSTSMLKLSGNPGCAVFVRIENKQKVASSIKKIILKLDGVGKKNACRLRLRVLPYNAQGNNAVDMLPEPLIVRCNKNKMVVDVQKYNLTFREDGITVAVEWIADEGMSIRKGNINYPCLHCTGKVGASSTYTYSASNGTLTPLIVPDEVPKWLLERTQNACVGITVQ